MPSASVDSRQVRRANERRTLQRAAAKVKAEARKDRARDVRKRQREREKEQEAAGRSAGIPLVNLIGRDRVYVGWFNRGRYASRASPSS